MDNGPDLRDEGQLQATGAAVGLGCSIVVTLVGLIGGGVWLDQRFGTAPTLTFIGLAIALIAAGYELYELAKVGRKDTTAGPIGRGLSRLTSGSRRTNSAGPATGRGESVRMDGEE